MQTPINWIKYEGRVTDYGAGRYLVYGKCIKDGRLYDELRCAEITHKTPISNGHDILPKIWSDLEHFVIEYIAPLSEIERGIEEALTKTT